MVKLWWIDGELWCLGGRILIAKICHDFEIYFWEYATILRFIFGWVWKAKRRREIASR